MQGVVTGITANAVLIKNALLAAVTTALTAVKATLQIASPSRVFADEIGSPIAEGIMLGMQAKALLLADTMHRVSAGALAGARSESTTYQVNANYRYQDERSVRDGLVMLTMLTGKR